MAPSEDYGSLQLQAEKLRQQVEAAELQLQTLKSQLRDLELTLRNTDQQRPMEKVPDVHPRTDSTWPLTASEYQRYGRQMIMPEVGLQGQLQLKRSRVLVVGLGGLGCPAAAYLAGAGVGKIGLIDGDTVEISNLHRQIVHSTGRIGTSKVDSAYEYLSSLNPTIDYVRHPSRLTPEDAIPIFEQYDLVLDCTDHPTSRYLISDASVLTGKPLVSGSALKTEGQLIVLNDPPRQPGDLSGGPCYRCIFPRPPPAESVLSCGEGGILGPVVGVMGVLQALEAIKLLARQPKTASTEDPPTAGPGPRASMLMFSAYSSPQFRNVCLRSRRVDCATCSEHPIVAEQSLLSGSLDYVKFCGRSMPVDLLGPERRTTAEEFVNLPQNESRTLIDVRDSNQYAICALPNSINIPWTGSAETWVTKAKQGGITLNADRPMYLICRYGNDSQLAAKALIDRASSDIDVKDIKDGLEAWRNEVDPTWPDY